ncbi:acyltransferase family protein [Streptomyces sp. DT171]|uniref:acyltransferase family protein n=1 Tax=Streptomyces sp. DT171 TaxID=3416524 RepID=UPI003CE887A8
MPSQSSPRQAATAPSSPPSRSTLLSRLPSLTGMRFVAAVMVFFFHSSLTTEPPLNPFSGTASDIYHSVFTKTGWIGVSFFFILSGFVLTYSAKADDTPRRFMRRRLVKLYPNHVVSWALAMVLFAGATATWRQWLPNLLLVQTWIPRYDTFLSINPPSWSLSCEVIFYLSFPLLHRWIKKIDPARLWAWAAGVVAVVTLIPAVAYVALPDGTMSNGFPVSDWQYWVVYMLPPVRTLEFVLGILMARIVLSGRWINLRLLPAAALLVVGYAVANVVPWLFSLNAAALIPLALLIPAAATTDLSGRRSPFRGRVMLWLGEVSFAFYMVHGVVMIYFRSLLGYTELYSTPVGIGVIALYMGLSLAVAWLLHTVVETPMMRRFSRPRRRTPQSATARSTDLRITEAPIDGTRDDVSARAVARTEEKATAGSGASGA